MKTFFSETLIRLRREAGFTTAYQFYYDNGGRGVLKTSYRRYLLMEQGKALPLFPHLPVYIFALRLVPKSSYAFELILAWLKTTTGNEAFKDLIEPMLKEKLEHAITSPLHKVIKKSLVQKKYYISPVQMEAIVKNRENHFCYMALSSDSGRWTPKDLAAALGLSPAAAANSMKELAKVKILRKVTKDAYKCHLAGSMVELPHADMVPALYQKWKALITALIASGKQVYLRRGIVRADERDFTNLFPLLSLNISSAASYETTRRTEKTAIFVVENKVLKICDF